MDLHIEVTRNMDLPWSGERLFPGAGQVPALARGGRRLPPFSHVVHAGGAGKEEDVETGRRSIFHGVSEGSMAPPTIVW